MSNTVEQLLQNGLKAHKLGLAAVASRFYSAILETHPLHSEANYNMGLLAVSSGKVQVGLEFFETALESNADNAFCWVNYIDALLKLGRLLDAQSVLDQAKINGARGEGFDELEARLQEALGESLKTGNTCLEEKDPQLQTVGSSSLDQAIRLAQKKSKEDALEEAFSIYLDILCKFPKNKNAYDGIKALSVKIVKRASKVPEPSQDELQALVDRYTQGDLEQALKQADNLSQKFPMSAALLNIQGIVLQDLNQNDLSHEAFRKALSIRPDYAEVYNNMGNGLKASGKLKEAIVSYNKALTIEPDYGDAHYNLGVVLAEQGKSKEAIEAFVKSLNVRPDFADAYYNMGNALQETGKLDEAIEAYKKVLVINPIFPDVHNNLASIFQQQGKLDEAMESYNKEIACNPHDYLAYHNRGVILFHQGKLEESLEAYNQALIVNPRSAQVQYSMGITFKEQGMLERAEEAFNKAIAIDPEYAEAQFSLSFLLLNSGRLKEGLELQEWRWKVGANVSEQRHFLRPVWDGKVSLGDKKILIWCEQGIGDIVRNSYLLRFISAQAEHCVLECPQKLIPLLSQSFPKIEVRIHDSNLDSVREDFDFHLPIGSLHKHFLTELTQNTKPTAFLIPDPIRVNFWKSYLSALGSGPYVGISWSSSLQTANREQFYAPISEWEPLLTLENITFINLQYVHSRNDLIQIKDDFGVTVHNIDFLDQYNDLDDVAALVSALDCVVSIGNAVPTISAGVGTSTKLAVPANADWDNIIGNPVGPLVDIYRKSTSEPWSNVFRLIAKDIAEL